jgi:PTH1 family peptidyl-tRNA hydrolase
VTALQSFLGLFRRKRPARKAELLIFGIGNPGDKYKGTRHNAGFMVVDCLSGLLINAHTVHDALFDATRGTLSGKEVVLVKPLTFVNRCGAAYAASASRFGVPQESALVIVDDYHLPLGAIRLRRGGSDGGHNGLASIREWCGENFPRLRMGIGPLPAGAGSVDFVLGKFDERETPARSAALGATAEAATVFCTGGIDAAMNLFNRSR